MYSVYNTVSTGCHNLDSASMHRISDDNNNKIYNSQLQVIVDVMCIS